MDEYDERQQQDSDDDGIPEKRGRSVPQLIDVGQEQANGHRDADVQSVIEPEQRRHGSDHAEDHDRRRVAACGVVGDGDESERVEKDFRIVVQARKQHHGDYGRNQCQEHGSGRADSQIKRERRAERHECDGQNGLAEQILPERHQSGRGGVIVQRQTGIEEVADRNLAEQNLPCPREMDEVVVGEIDRQPAEDPRRRKHQHRHRSDGPAVGRGRRGD